MLEKCKVLECNNRVMQIREKAKAEEMKGTYGYCQIHNIEGLIKEIPSKEIKE